MGFGLKDRGLKLENQIQTTAPIGGKLNGQSPMALPSRKPRPSQISRSSFRGPPRNAWFPVGFPSQKGGNSKTTHPSCRRRREWRSASSSSLQARLGPSIRFNAIFRLARVALKAENCRGGVRAKVHRCGSHFSISGFWVQFSTRF